MCQNIYLYTAYKSSSEYNTSLFPCLQAHPIITITVTITMSQRQCHQIFQMGKTVRNLFLIDLNFSELRSAHMMGLVPATTCIPCNKSQGLVAWCELAIFAAKSGCRDQRLVP